MAANTTTPITVSEEAKARITELGMQREFEQMLEHTLQSVPGLRAIRVELAYDPDRREDPGITIWSVRPDPAEGEYDPVDDEWGQWKIDHFPPEVCLNFVMLSTPEAP
jgi:hypothetical protein